MGGPEGCSHWSGYGTLEQKLSTVGVHGGDREDACNLTAVCGVDSSIIFLRVLRIK